MGFIDSEEVCKLYAKCIQNSVCVCVFVESRCTVFHVCDTIMVVSTKIQQCEDWRNKAKLSAQATKTSRQGCLGLEGLSNCATPLEAAVRARAVKPRGPDGISAARSLVSEQNIHGAARKNIWSVTFLMGLNVWGYLTARPFFIHSQESTDRTRQTFVIQLKASVQFPDHTAHSVVQTNFYKILDISCEWQNYTVLNCSVIKAVNVFPQIS